MNDDGGGHFYVVITPPTHSSIVIINFTSIGPRKDQTCLLQPGEHAVLQTESVVAFERAKVVSTLEIQKLIDNGTAEMKAKVTRELMLKIWDAAFVTRRMQNRPRELLEQFVPK